jgi:hypothetical protein
MRLEGCHSCGAVAVGPPLARPERELPAYGLTLAAGASGALLAFVFAASTAVALFERKTFSGGLWDVLGAAETAAWRLKWVVLPLSLLAAYFGRHVVARVSREPWRYAGARMAHAGFALSALVAFSSFALIGVTVPERLRLRHEAAVAADNVEAYESVKVLLEYQQQYGSLPANSDDLAKLPDADGSVARAAEMIRAGRYEPDAALASLPSAAGAPGQRNMKVSVRPVALRRGEEMPAERLAFTNYTLRLPGKDKRLGTADDLFVRDGMIVAAPAEEEKPSQRAGAPREVKLP